MTQNPCNCETCTKHSKIERVINAGKRCHRCNELQEQTILLDACDGKVLRQGTIEIAKEHGCLSHPQAREYLMRDVIDTLESKYCMADGYLASKAYADAITLIKRGVRK